MPRSTSPHSGSQSTAAEKTARPIFSGSRSGTDKRSFAPTTLAKGRKIALEGRLKYRTWEDEGKKRSAIEVVAYRVEFLSAPAASGGEVVPFEAAVA